MRKQTRTQTQITWFIHPSYLQIASPCTLKHKTKKLLCLFHKTTTKCFVSQKKTGKIAVGTIKSGGTFGHQGQQPEPNSVFCPWISKLELFHFTSLPMFKISLFDLVKVQLTLILPITQKRTIQAKSSPFLSTKNHIVLIKLNEATQKKNQKMREDHQSNSVVLNWGLRMMHLELKTYMYNQLQHKLYAFYSMFISSFNNRNSWSIYLATTVMK